MAGWVKAGSLYFAAVFVIAFAVGTVRVLFVAPHVGELVAVCLEIPVVLAVAWRVCRKIHLRVSYSNPIAMGALAFALLMAAELGLAMLLFGRPAGEYLSQYRTLPAQLGLAGQIAFGWMPWIQHKTG